MFELFITETMPALLGKTSLISFIAVFAAGILTSISPCVLSMVPVLVGIIGGYSQPSKFRAFLLSAFFVLGMATTFAILGLAAGVLGTIFGRIGRGWYYAVSAVSIIMGLNLLGVWRFQIPGLKIVPPKVGGFLGSYLAGLLFGVVASPCATPVLVAILALVSTAGKTFAGTLLLFVYGLGHGVPLLVVGTFTGALKSISLVQRRTKYINYVSGVILLIIGFYFLYFVGGF